MNEIQFEWDENKNLANQRKHGIRFEEAIFVFDDPLAVSYKERIVEGEQRWQTLGMIDELLMVAHTVWVDDDAEVVRMISARTATRRERKRYESENG